MQVTSNTVKSFVNLSRAKCLLDVSHDANIINKINFNTLAVNKNVYRQLENDAFSKCKDGAWQLIGEVKLPNRNTGELQPVQIKRYSKGRKIKYRLDSNTEKLLYLESKVPFAFKKILGLNLSLITKLSEKSELKGLAKLADKILVKESLKQGTFGKVTLETVAFGEFSNAEPLHFKRGYRPKGFSSWAEKAKNKYENMMQDVFDLYAKARVSGNCITNAKNIMAKNNILQPKSMVLSPQLVEKYSNQYVIHNLN